MHKHRYGLGLRIIQSQIPYQPNACRYQEAEQKFCQCNVFHFAVPRKLLLLVGLLGGSLYGFNFGFLALIL